MATFPGTMAAQGDTPHVARTACNARRRTRFLFPSLADLVFVLFLCMTYKFFWQGLLADCDIGWHIRNGDHILATGLVPRVDYFSYTMPGRPWFAWEWLYDAIISIVHHAAGLNGVVLYSSLIFAFTFTQLFRLSWRRSGSMPVALVLTFTSAAAASIHLFGRPHLVTWLFTLIWFDRLDAFQRGRNKYLLALPLTMPLWVNLHGGFLMGVALLGLFIAGNAWTAFTAASRIRRGLALMRCRRLAHVLALTLAATLLTPYGFRLYPHLRTYLGDTFLMDHIFEFLSPNFHVLQVKAFALLLLMVIGALALGTPRLRMLDVLVIAFAVWVSLYSTRNIPLAVILLTLTISPWLGASLRRLPQRKDLDARWRRFAAGAQNFVAWTNTMEQRLAGHLWPAVVIVALAFSARIASAHTQTAINFNDKQFPVAAGEYMAAHNIRDRFFTPDVWSGYMIYRLYPDVHMMMDDRHDFYGSPFVRDYLTMLQVGPGWQKLLVANQVNWVIAPCESPLTNALRAVNGWRVVHEDPTAVILQRVVPVTEMASAGR